MLIFIQFQGRRKNVKDADKVFRKKPYPLLQPIWRRTLKCYVAKQKNRSLKVKTVPITEAVGTVLAHDITRIVRNGFKGPAFKKGHIVQEEDIPGLLDLGKKRLFVFDLADGFLHENDAAGRIAKASAGEGIMFTPPSEGKINLKAGGAGLLKINVEALQQVNAIEEIMFAN